MKRYIELYLLILATLAMIVCIWAGIATPGSRVGSAIARAISLRVIPPHPFQREHVTVGSFNDPPNVRILEENTHASGGPRREIKLPDQILVARGAVMIRNRGLWGTTRRKLSLSITCEQFDRDRSVHSAEMERLAVDCLQQLYAARGYSASLTRTVANESTVHYRGSVDSIAWAGVMHNAITLLGGGAFAYLVFYRNVLLRKAELPPRECYECGYDLRGAKHEKCPECGAPVES